MIQRKEEKNAKTGGDDQCQKRKRWPSTRVSEPLNAAVAAAVVVVEGGRRRREGRGWGSLLGVELVLQLHELPGSFDLVGNLLPLREETLALLKGQALRSVTGDGVLLLLTDTRM